MQALLAIDGSDESRFALDTAAALDWPPGSRLEVVSVIPSDIELFGGPWPAVAYVQSFDVRDRLVAERRRWLESVTEPLARDGLDVVAHPLEGRAASVIVHRAETTGAELIIVGARGHGTLERVLLGSVSAEVVDRAHCPVLVARRTSVGRILVATDGSPDATAATAFVGSSGLFGESQARVLDVIDVPAAWWLGIAPGDAAVATEAYLSVLEDANRHGREIAESAAQRLRTAGLGAVAAVREGGATGSILAEAAAWDADLVVVGTRGHGLVARWLLGSTARAVLQRAPMSILVVRQAPEARPDSDTTPSTASTAS